MEKKKEPRVKVLITDHFVLIGFGLAILYWAIDSFLYIFLSYDIKLFMPWFPWIDTNEIWARIVVLCLFAIFGSHAQYTINSRKLVEEELRFSEARYRNIIESIEEGYFEIDLHGDMIFFNNSLINITGYSRSELQDINIRYFFVTGTSSDSMEIYKLVKRTGEPAILNDYEMSRKDGSTIILEQSISLIKEGSEDSSGFRIVVRDVSERRHAEEERKKLEEQLQHARKLESIGTIASGVAHNFRNILSGISVNTQLLQMGGEIDEQSLMTKTDRIQSAVKRGALLVDGLMQFSRKGGSQNFKEFNLKGIMQEVHEIIKETYDESINISADIGDNIYINGDSSSITHIIVNMCNNARDAMPGGGNLTISTKAEGENAEIKISDNGQGMNEKTLQKCFDPFFTTKDVDKGTGLGLSTSYGIVKEHGGDISVASEVGKGTLFIILLPMVEVEPGQIPEVPTEVIKGNGQKVLLVDDESDMREPMEDFLRSIGYLASSAENGEEALEKYFSWNPDAVLMDRNMPEMDGLTCAETIIEKDPDAKIILMSGYDESGIDGVDSRSLELIQGYLIKPINLIELSHTLAELFK